MACFSWWCWCFFVVASLTLLHGDQVDRPTTLDIFQPSVRRNYFKSAATTLLATVFVFVFVCVCVNIIGLSYFV